VAVKMTEDYMKTFTSLGSLLQNIGKSERHSDKISEDIGDEIEKRVREKLEKKRRERESDEDEEE
jgi:hypothetical protein